MWRGWWGWDRCAGCWTCTGTGRLGSRAPALVARVRWGYYRVACRYGGELDGMLV